MRYLALAWLAAMVAVCCLNSAQAEEPEGNNRAKLLEKFDTNKDGKLDESERAAAREAVKKRPGGEARTRPAEKAKGRPTREEILQQFDANGDGRLDETERAKIRDSKEKRGDNDGQGPRPNGPQLGGQGFGPQGGPLGNDVGGGAAGRLSDAQRGEMMKRMDANGDGKIDESERARAKEIMMRMKQNGGKPGARPDGPPRRPGGAQGKARPK